MNNDKKGVAVKYGAMAPMVVAVARGKLVARMLEIAKINNITVYKDSDLAEVLSNLKVGMDIPEDLFIAVSEVLAYCYRVNSDFKVKMDRAGI